PRSRRAGPGRRSVEEMRLALRALGLGLWTLTSAATVAPKTLSPEPKAVAIKQFLFAPAEMEATVGDSVVWVNNDPFMHTVAADSGAWTSPVLLRGERFAIQAKRAGRFPYHCAAHPVMHGVLVVRGR